MSTTTTTTTLVHPQPTTPLFAEQCPHLGAWLGAKPELALERLRNAAGSPSGLADSIVQASSTPPCSTCNHVSLRPFVCLTCTATLCGTSTNDSHACSHAEREKHDIAWDARTESMYCFPCRKYVVHPGFERVVVAERLNRTDYAHPVQGPPSKKRRRTRVEIGTSSLDAVSSFSIPARGIRNLGNSCYMSVILQTFFLNPFLRAYFLSDRHDRTVCERSLGGDACISCEMDYLFSEYYASEAPSLAPTRFLHAFWQSSFEALGYAQQDAHEFLISTLNLLHSHSPCPTDNPSIPCPCIIHKTFSGQLRSQVRCGRCGHQSETFEPFLDLSLDVRDRVHGKDFEHVQACLKSFTAPENLPASYDCAACGTPPEPATKRMSIKALPQVLYIQLKRFEHTSTAGSKIDTYVRFPLELDMSPHLSSTLDYPTAKTPPYPQRYNLVSVVAHEGSLTQGHYTAYVRGTDDFFHIDDDKVRRASIGEVVSSKAYLLVYSRI
ncbi:hypothetical protein JCM10212_003451 [Sporobolomyces blumeae]